MAMENKLKTYKELMAVSSLSGIKTGKAIDIINTLADTSVDLREIEGLYHSRELADKLFKRKISSIQSILLNYTYGTLYSNINEFTRKGKETTWDWEQYESEKSIYHLRKALINDAFIGQPKEIKSRILTNLANQIDFIGRFVEAIEYYDKSIEIDPSFGMPLGSRGVSYCHYATSHYDPGQARRFLQYAYFDLTKARELTLEGNSEAEFKRYIDWIESVLPNDYIVTKKNMDEYPLGDTREEEGYRKWCLTNRLFLNPLNDIGPYAIAGRDILSAPSIVVKTDEGPYYHGFFDQLKQEFVSARYLYFEGITTKEPHFSDKDVLIYNTLDYPVYGLSIEKVKIAYRMAYSIFDKIAFFLKYYYELTISERRVSFRNLWYVSERRDEVLNPMFQGMKNWSLRGLYSLSKDLHDSSLKDALEPDAQAIANIRNYLEHKCLRVTELTSLSNTAPNDSFMRYPDKFAFFINRRDFESKTLKLLKLVRASLIYLSLAVHNEEKTRKNTKYKDGKLLKRNLNNFEDEWKK